MRPSAAGLRARVCRIMSEAFSPIITQAALVLPETTVGMIEASATRRPVKAVHAQALVHHGGDVRAHAAGRGRVEHGRALLACELEIIVVALYLRPEHQLFVDVAR